MLIYFQAEVTVTFQNAPGQPRSWLYLQEVTVLWRRHLGLVLCELTFHDHHKLLPRASLVALWIRIRLPVQSAQVRSPVQENAPCLGATKPEHHNYWGPRAWSPCSTTREATTGESLCTPAKSSPCSLQLEKARVQQQRPSTATNRINCCSRPLLAYWTLSSETNRNKWPNTWNKPRDATEEAEARFLSMSLSLPEMLLRIGHTV